MLAYSGAGASGIGGVWHVGPRPAVRAICHVGDALWVGTADGLFILDIRNGSLIERIDAGPRLPSASVRGIAAAGDSVFVATDDGLALFRGTRAQLFTPRDPGRLRAVPLSKLHAVSVGRNRDVIVATLGHGAGVITRSGGYAITRRDSLIDDIVFDVKDAPRGPRYFATNAGLCAQIDDTTFAWYQAGTGLPRGETRQLTVGPNGVVHVLVARQGIYRFEGTRAVGLPVPNDIPVSDALSISAGVDGALWAAGHGWIAVRRDNRWRRMDAAGDARTVWRTIVADGGGAFAGSGEGVVLAIGRGGAMRVDLGDGLPAPRVGALAPDGRGSAWFVSGGHLASADARAKRFMVENTPPDARMVAISPGGRVVAAGRWTVRERGQAGWTDLRPDVTESDPAFTAARFDGDGALWVGTRSGAIYRYDGEIWLRMARGPETLDGRGIADVRSTPGGTWAIGAGVPVRCASGNVERFPGIDSTEVVVDLERAPSGEWVAVTGERLFVFDERSHAWKSRGVSYLAPGARDRVEGRLTAIALAPGGMVYLGSTAGLGVASAGGTRWLRAGDGTGGGEVADVVVDGGRLWVGFAQDGLSVIPLESVR